MCLCCVATEEASEQSTEFKSSSNAEKKIRRFSNPSHAQKKNKCHLVKTGSCSGLDNGTFSQLLQKCSRKLVLQEQLDGSSGSKQAPLVSLFRPCWICVPQTHLFKEKSGLLGGKIRGAALRPPV